MIVAKSNEELKYLVSEVQKDKLKLDEIDVSEVQDFSSVFENFTFDPKYGSIENWNVSNGIYFIGMFKDAKNTFLLNLSKWRLSKAENCNYMFSYCKDFIGGDLSNWNPINLKSAKNMFNACENFRGRGLDKWYLPNLMDASNMFAECKNFDQNLSNWDCRNLKNLKGMFTNCTKFRGIGLEKWNITLINNRAHGEEKEALNYTFRGCINFDADLSSWKVEGSFYLDLTFEKCKNFKGKGLEKWKITVPEIEKFGVLFRTFENCLKLDFSKNPNWKFQASKNGAYYRSFTKAVSLTTAKFLNPNIPIYDDSVLVYYKGKNFYQYKQTYGLYSVEDLPDNMTFGTDIYRNEDIDRLMNPELSLPNLKKPITINIRTYKISDTPQHSHITPRTFKLSSKRIRLKRIDKYFLEPFKKEYGYLKNSIPLNVKYGEGPHGYLLAKKVETILPKIPYYKLVQKIPVYEDNKIQAPNTILVEAQEKSFSKKLFFNTKNIFFNKDYIKCF